LPGGSICEGIYNRQKECQVFQLITGAQSVKTGKALDKPNKEQKLTE